MAAAHCLFCDKPLSFRCHTEWEDTPIPPCDHCGGRRYVCHEQVLNPTTAHNEDGRKVFRCSNCEPDEPVLKGWKARTVKSRKRWHDKPGPYGDGFFCSLTCGYRFGVAAAKAGYRLAKKGT
jgi:hypothetical protein